MAVRIAAAQMQMTMVAQIMTPPVREWRASPPVSPQLVTGQLPSQLARTRMFDVVPVRQGMFGNS